MKRMLIPLMLCLALCLAACCQQSAEMVAFTPRETARQSATTPPQASASEPIATAIPTEPETVPPAVTQAPATEPLPTTASAPTQPGDTQSTWDPARAEDFPADEDCTSLELLEKWMIVEGLTMSDLEARGCRQLVVVIASQADGISTCTNCYEQQEDGSWYSVEGLTQMGGWTGSNGIMHGRMRNSLTSPAGLWQLGFAFGNEEMPDGLKMPWRDVTPNTDWVCDDSSIYFNTWQERDDPALTQTWNDDVEHLENYPSSYAYACVIEFNTPPYVVPEQGCAIFFHCAKGPTEGCIGLPEQQMIETLLWLDPALNPYILITGYQA